MADKEHRESKQPNRYQDCLLDEDLDELLDNGDPTALQNPDEVTDHEKPQKHLQVDGKTNNVSFKTDRIKVWKAVIINHFGKTKTNIQPRRAGEVYKVTFDSNSSVKINIFDSGSVVIQGAKCVVFADTFFNNLKLKCDKYENKEDMNVAPQLNGESQAKTLDDSPMHVRASKKISACTRSMTKAKSLEDLNVSILTPTRDDQFKTPKGTKSAAPKERLQQHSKSMDSKFNELHTIISTMDNTMLTCMEKLGELQKVTNDLPGSLQNTMKDHLICHKKKIIENLDTLEAKVKHCSSTLDSLHVKSNTIDTQLKKIEDCQKDNKSALHDISESIGKLTERVEECQKDHKTVTHVMSESIDKLTERLEDVERRLRNMPTVNSTPNFDWHNETIKHVEIEKDASRGPLDDSHSTDKLPVSHNKENKPPINCDHLILTDSILGRIQPKRFTPKS